MDQLSLSLRPVHKNANGNGNGNGNGHGNGHRRPGHKQFSGDLRRLIDDLRAAEELRAAELKRLQTLRKSVYADAARHGVKPQILRAVLSLQSRRAAP